jgi:sigma-E factor negative regulatory protein RseB
VSASVHVSHEAGAGSLIEVEPTATTPGRTVFEPAGEGADGVSGPTADALALVRRNYVVVLDGSDDILGRPVDVVLVRSHAGRPVQRLWIDRASSLPLRRAFYDDQAKLVRQAAFVSLSERPQAVASVQTATIPMRSKPTVDAAALRSAGWSVPPAPDGMVAYDAVLSSTGPDAVLHLAYTDGIGTVSVFEQRGRLDASQLRGWRRAQIGGVGVWVAGSYPRRVVWSAGDRVYTIVTECDEDVVAQTVRSLPRGQRPDGLRRRVRRGALRVASWVNPAR